MADITGANASQALNGTSDPDTVEALGGSDQVEALGGADTISGGDGADTLRGGDGNDVIYGHSIADMDSSSGNITATLLADVGFGALFATGAPGDDGFVYALKKNSGEIVRIDAASGAQSTFLDIPDPEFSTQSERGVLGLAFHPDYESNGRFFVYLTNPTGDIELREYARSAGDPATADPALVQTILTIPHSTFANHNGGSLAFGPDGYLYIATGDGGGSNDPDGNAQNLDVLLGKILRIDVDGDDFPADPSRNYAIPDDNPFAGAMPGADEIWAYGLRNPWRISFDSATGDLYIGDVGQGAREEVNFEAAGGVGGLNYGWDFREGKIQGPSAPPVPPLDFTEPVFDYPRDVGRSITGGYVYHGPAPGMQGVYFFADFITGRLMTLRMVEGVAVDTIERTDQLVGADLGGISSFGTDNAGNLYVVTFSGAIYRLDPAVAAGDGVDVIDGGAGDDNLFGGVGKDTLSGGQGNDSLTGGAGADNMRGGAGNDVYVIDGEDVINESIAGSGGTDTVQSSISFSLANTASLLGAVENLTLLGSGDITGTGNALGNRLAGNAGNNTLGGGAGDDSIHGFDGNDWLDGGTGEDLLKGGTGNDTYVVDAAGDTIDEEGNADAGDSVRSSLSVDLNILGGGKIEHAVLLGAAALNAFGTAAGNALSGNAAANLLDGNGGADTMTGGNGSDVYVVDDEDDKAIEANAAAAGGVDLVKASVSFKLGANVEKLTLTASADIDGTGNAFNNTLLGNAGDNRLDGGAGKDSMTGGGGDDTYVVDSTGDVVTEKADGGTDTVESAIAFSLATRVHIENLALIGSAITATGNGLGNIITGNALANILDGGTGADTLRGGSGNDLYILDNAGDLVDEQGNVDPGDEVKSASIRFAAIAGIENYTYTGSAAWTFAGDGSDNRISGGSAADKLDGAGGNDTIFGNAGNDTLAGAAGNDALDGGLGNDVMLGGAGNDTYVLNAAGDKIDEEGNSDSADLVRSSISVDLAALAAGRIEHATLTGTAAINATGNLGDNHLVGNDGANILNGAGGADILEGGKGSDTYFVDDPGDQVIESVGGATGGTDLVKSAVSFILGANLEKLTLLGSEDIDATGNGLNNTLIGNDGANILDGGAGSDSMTGGKGDDTYVVNAAGDSVIETIGAGGGVDTVQSAVTFSLAARVNVENLVLTGAGNINGTGNGLANHVTGNDGANTLNGAAGDDTILGGLGADRLTGGTGRDVFEFNLAAEAGDTITDFTKGAAGDVLDLRGILDEVGYAGADPFADDVLSFVPDGANTLIRIDADGSDPGSALTIATLLNTKLTEADTANYLVADI
jgi:Ca2+-binding RTX toxin-like protein